MIGNHLHLPCFGKQGIPFFIHRVEVGYSLHTEWRLDNAKDGRHGQTYTSDYSELWPPENIQIFWISVNDSAQK